MRAEGTYGVTFAGEYPEGGAEESNETESKLGPPQGLNRQGLAAPVELRNQGNGESAGTLSYREIVGRPGQLPPVRVVCRTPAAVPWMPLLARQPRWGIRKAVPRGPM